MIRIMRTRVRNNDKIVKPKTKKYITVNTLDNSVHIVITKSYWKALKEAQQWFGNNAKIRVYRDTLSSTH